MNDTGSEKRNETYQRMRSDFDALSAQEKVVFLAEAASSTVVRGAQQFGEALSEEIDEFLGRSEKPSGKEASGADDEDISVADAAGAVARSLQRFGQVLSHEVEDLFRKRFGEDEAAREEAAREEAAPSAAAGDDDAQADDAGKTDEATA